MATVSEQGISAISTLSWVIATTSSPIFVYISQALIVATIALNQVVSGTVY